jgi:hypothetical protein
LPARLASRFHGFCATKNLRGDKKIRGGDFLVAGKKLALLQPSYQSPRSGWSSTLARVSGWRRSF